VWARHWPLGASALVASIGDIRTFKNGRQAAAWLGLVPRQDSSGGKTCLLGIYGNFNSRITAGKRGSLRRGYMSGSNFSADGRANRFADSHPAHNHCLGGLQTTTLPRLK